MTARSDDYREGFFAGYRAGWRDGSDATHRRVRRLVEETVLPVPEPEEAGEALVDALIADREAQRHAKTADFAERVNAELQYARQFPRRLPL